MSELGRVLINPLSVSAAQSMSASLRKRPEVLRCRELTRCAVTGLTHCSKPGARLQRLFDHLVGRGQARSLGSRGRAQALFRAAPQYRRCNFRLSLPLELTIFERWYSLRHVRRYDLG